MKTMKMMKALKKLKVWSKKKRNKMQRRTSSTTLVISGSGDCCPLLPMHSAEIETETEITISSSSAYWNHSSAPSAPPLPPWLVLQHEEEEEEEHEHEHRFNFACPCPPEPRDEAFRDLTTLPPSGGMIGCVVQFGIHVFRCFCPCFHVRDPHHHPKLHAN